MFERKTATYHIRADSQELEEMPADVPSNRRASHQRDLSFVIPGEPCGSVVPLYLGVFLAPPGLPSTPLARPRPTPATPNGSRRLKDREKQKMLAG